MKHDNGTFELDRAEARALIAFTHTKSPSPVFAVIHCDPSRGRMVATDGSTLGTVSDVTTSPGMASYGILVGDFVQAAKIMAPKGTLRVSRGCLEITGPGIPPMTIQTEPKDANHVDFDQCIDLKSASEPEPVEQWCVDAKFLARLLAVQTASRGYCVTCHAPNKTDLGSVKMTAGPWTVVIMSMNLRQR